MNWRSGQWKLHSKLEVSLDYISKAEQTKRQANVFSVRSEARLWSRQFCSWTLACKDMIKVWIEIMPFLKKQWEEKRSRVTLYTKERYRSWRIHWRKMLKKTWELSGLKKRSSRQVKRSSKGIHKRARREKMCYTWAVVINEIISSRDKMDNIGKITHKCIIENLE